VKIDPEDLAAIYYTGGTTGKPKGVMLSHRSWIYTYLIEMLELGLGWNEVFVFPTPLTHAGGCFMLPILIRGGSCVILDSFDPKLFLGYVGKAIVLAEVGEFLIDIFADVDTIYSPNLLDYQGPLPFRCRAVSLALP
jgi:acyl-CoA synthetase (AMP-forming)/AMP-acid ligase II